MIKNPYFSTKSNELPEGKPLKPDDFEQVKLGVRKGTDFKTYPAAQIEGAPTDTPEKGFTSIIIPAFFNSYPIWHTTGNCIGSIREHTDKEKTPYEIILIQNGNTGIGFTEKTAKDSYADKVIFNEENLGYAKAVNQGIRCARGEYIAIINNDCQVFTHWLEDLQEGLNYVDLIQAYPMYGMPYGRAVEANKLRAETAPCDKPDQACQSAENHLDDFRDFSCVLTTKELFSKVGLFNERFFAYGEDLDLIRRIEKVGGKVKSTKRVRVHHIIGMTSSGMEGTPKIMDEAKEILKEIWGE